MAPDLLALQASVATPVRSAVPDHHGTENIGAGLQLSPNASGILSDLGVLPELAEAGLTWAVVDPLASRAPQPVKSEDGRAARARYIETVQWFGEEVIAKVRRNANWGKRVL